MTTATATATDTRHIRELLPLGLMRDLPGALPAQPLPPEEPPSSITRAIVRWLNEEL
ncbi:hypothetical protein [Hyalangium sp.]|uniref:hypothetical protein n=1 Tax=Hyalangium sp. TaxID=2028555 RepID=UPI002D38001E|nr:hypothetical protein [Hyalangium sp.]HYH98155.1 hypothetical protein [Hyalangium sp.]